jgi:hypothetical protein
MRASWITVTGGDPRTPFLRCIGLVAALGLAFVGVRESESPKLGETPEPPFSASLGLAAALGLAFLGFCASWIAVVGGDLEPPSPLRWA